VSLFWYRQETGTPWHLTGSMQGDVHTLCGAVFTHPKQGKFRFKSDRPNKVCEACTKVTREKGLSSLQRVWSTDFMLTGPGGMKGMSMPATTGPVALTLETEKDHIQQGAVR
jgi:hypothetical protein